MFDRPIPIIDRLKMALSEDVGTGDVTTDRTIPRHTVAEAIVTAKQDGVFSGGFIYPMLLAAAGANVDPACVASNAGATWYHTVRDILEREDNLHSENVNVEFLTDCPARVTKGTPLMRMTGPARTLLIVERIGLNLIGRMSGIATQTRAFVDRCDGYAVEILCTRKTTPLWRDLEKLAVIDGGGKPHRIGLYDMVLIKDNHLAAVGGDIETAVKQSRLGARVPVEIEVENLNQFNEALRADPDFILLDNMDIDTMARAVELCHATAEKRGSRPKLEASGNVSLNTVAQIAATGVDRISVGSLTHSVSALDLSMRMTLKPF